MSTDRNPRFTADRFICPNSLDEFMSTRPKVASWFHQMIGFPSFTEPPPLNATMIYQADDGGYWRRKVRYGNESDDLVWAWLLVPKGLDCPAPAVICLPGSFMTPNWGKDGPAGLAGPWNAGHPEAYGSDLAKLGYVALCPDYPCAGERTSPGLKAYDTSALDHRHPDWSRVGLSTWDVSRAVDFLFTTPEVDTTRIACTGWSQGGQMTVLGGATDPRIKVLISVCGWSPFRGLAGPIMENMIQSYNFPGLQPYVKEETVIPYDFDHLAALIAPRPFLDLRATEDQYFPNVDEMCISELELHRLYELYDSPENYKTVMFPGKHAYTGTAARETQAWLYRHFY